MKRLLALTLVLLMIVSVLPASAATATILQAYASQTQPVMYVSVQGSKTGGVPSFTSADGKNLPVIGQKLATGHLIVLDHSKYYSEKITIKSLRAMVQAYLNLLPQQDMVKFIYAEEPNRTQPYMTVAEAKKSISSLSIVANAVYLTEAVAVAVNEATALSSSEPFIKAVCVIANPYDVKNMSSVSKNNSVRIQMTVITPTRSTWYSTVRDQKRRTNYSESLDQLRKLATDWNGNYVTCAHTGEGDKESISVTGVSSLSGKFSTVVNYAVDLKPLGSLANRGNKTQEFQITASSQDLGQTKFSVTVPVSLLPVTNTPVPRTGTAVPLINTSPKPTPIPIRVSKDQEGVEWREAMRRLRELYYLNEDHAKFDDASQLAYDLFCERNNIRKTDGIPADVYQRLVGGKEQFVPNPTPTPEPTPTPTIFVIEIPMAVKYGDRNPEWHAVMEILQELYYLDAGHLTYDDESQMAYEKFCRENSLDVTEGITREAYNNIIAARKSLKANPTATPEPVTATPYVVTPKPAAVTKGQSDLAWYRARIALQTLYYLPEGDFPSYDDTARVAYYEFCEANGIEPTDDILQEVYDALVNQTSGFKPKATPTPAPTDTPEPTPEPTPVVITPAPTIPPAVARGQNDFTWRQARVALQQLYYLPEGDYPSYDDEAREAYYEFCEANGIEPTDEIPKEVYEALVGQTFSFTPKATATPEPTAKPTPVVVETPTPVPPAVARGQNDTVWRAAMLALKELYYLDEDHYSYDEVSQAAFYDFCVANGIEPSVEIEKSVYDLLVGSTKGLRPKDTPTPAPTEEPTPTPEVTATPVPVSVRKGDSGPVWMRAMYVLKELYYLNEDHTSYDEVSQAAYYDFCVANGIDPTEDIETAVYELMKDVPDQLIPKPTATPTVAPTEEPTPEPSPTVGPDGLHLGDTDEKLPGEFITRLQRRLDELNCFATVDGVESYVPGEFDEATLRAVNAYCENYNVSNPGENGVTKHVVDTILETERTPRATPTLSFGERLRRLLTQPLFAIGGFQVLMWMGLLLCAVLIAAIVIILVVMRSDKKNYSAPVSSQPGRDPKVYEPLANVKPGGSAPTAPGTVPGNAPAPGPASGSMSQNKTAPVTPMNMSGGGVSMKTMPEGISRAVTLKVEYQNQTRIETAQFLTEYTMGRENCDLTLDASDAQSSRRHAKLVWRNDQLYVEDMNSTAGTYVNGNRISNTPSVSYSASSKTQLLDQPTEEAASGYLLANGDTIRLSRHYITVTW